MKHKRFLLHLTVGFAFLAIVCSASAILLAPFVSWDDLTARSSDIVIARCTVTPEPKVIVNEMVYSDIEVLSVLKGKTTNGVSRMFSGHWPRQGEQFLIFSGRHDGVLYNASESYRIVPISREFYLERLNGKSLKEQIQMILKSRLENLNKEMERAAEEKKRLEQGLK